MKPGIIQIAVGVVFVAFAPLDYLIQEWWQFGALLVLGALFLGVGLWSVLRAKARPETALE